MTEKQRQIIDTRRGLNQELCISLFESIIELFEWADNYDSGKSPLTVFLDIIGYTLEEYGEPFTSSMADAANSLGHFEIGQLGAALSEYAERPDYTYDFIWELLDAGIKDDDEETA